MQRKSTLAYGTTGTTTRTSSTQVARRRRLDSRPTSDAPPRSTPSSTPPSGLRLVQPSAVPRPTMSSIPPEPTSIRALVPRVALPRPAALPRIAPPQLEDEVEALDDADLTFVEEEAAPPPSRAPRAPLPPVPWTTESTPIPANRIAPTTPPPRPVAPVVDVVRAEAAVIADVAPVVVAPVDVAPVVAPLEDASTPRWIAPPAAVAPPREDDDALPPLSPFATVRARAHEAWAAASPGTRTALTFVAGFVAGGLAVAVL